MVYIAKRLERCQRSLGALTTSSSFTALLVRRIPPEVPGGLTLDSPDRGLRRGDDHPDGWRRQV